MSDQRTAAKSRRITAEVSPELYASLVAAKLFSGKALKILMQEGLQHVAATYREQRAAERARLASRATPTPLKGDDVD